MTVSLAVATVVMLLIRGSLSTATTALVLVVPVVAGTVVGGLVPGVIGIVVSFLVYDFLFIKPYYTLSVGAPQNWAALFVYTIVVLMVAVIVNALQGARAEAVRRDRDARQLFSLSELLLLERPLEELLQAVVGAVASAFLFSSVSLILPVDGKLVHMASAGTPFSTDELAELLPSPGHITSMLHVEAGARTKTTMLPLISNGEPVGILLIRGGIEHQLDAELLSTFANHAALAIAQAQLRGHVLRAERLEETDRWRRALLSSVSHDLRTPLASIKASVSMLRTPGLDLPPSASGELLATIEHQSDHLARLVANLLDMSRIDAGVLVAQKEPIEFGEIVDEALVALGNTIDRSSLQIAVDDDLPLVEADHVLIAQVLTNLIENGLRFSPPGSVVTISGRSDGDVVRVAVADRGPGVAEADRERIFTMFEKDGSSIGAGLGLAIAKSFIESHGARIAVRNREGGGAEFSFALARFDELEVG